MSHLNIWVIGVGPPRSNRTYTFKIHTQLFLSPLLTTSVLTLPQILISLDVWPTLISGCVKRTNGWRHKVSVCTRGSVWLITLFPSVATAGWGSTGNPLRGSEREHFICFVWFWFSLYFLFFFSELSLRMIPTLFLCQFASSWQLNPTFYSLPRHYRQVLTGNQVGVCRYGRRLECCYGWMKNSKGQCEGKISLTMSKFRVVLWINI